MSLDYFLRELLASSGDDRALAIMCKLVCGGDIVAIEVIANSKGLYGMDALVRVWLSVAKVEGNIANHPVLGF